MPSRWGKAARIWQRIHVKPCLEDFVLEMRHSLLMGRNSSVVGRNFQVETDSASSSCCCTFSSIFCVAMPEHLCSNPWGTVQFETAVTKLGPEQSCAGTLHHEGTIPTGTLRYKVP